MLARSPVTFFFLFRIILTYQGLSARFGGRRARCVYLIAGRMTDATRRDYLQRQIHEYKALCADNPRAVDVVQCKEDVHHDVRQHARDPAEQLRTVMSAEVVRRVRETTMQPLEVHDGGTAAGLHPERAGVRVRADRSCVHRGSRSAGDHGERMAAGTPFDISR